MIQRMIFALAVSSVGIAVIAGGEPPRKIAPESIYATTGQPNVKKLMGVVDAADMKKVHESRKDRAPAVFLVAGKDIAAAAKASIGLLAPRKDDAPPQEVKLGKTDTLWVGAYLGSTGSNPPQFVVESVEVSAK